MNQKLPTEDIGNCDLKSEPSTSDGFTQRNRRESNKKKMICFVCNIESSDDQKPFNNGGLARCSEVNAFDKLENAMNIRLKDEGNEYHTASKRLEILLCGPSYDAFAVDVYYHKCCYNKFVYNYMSASCNMCIDSKQLEEEAMGAHVMERFFMLFHRGIIKDH